MFLDYIKRTIKDIMQKVLFKNNPKDDETSMIDVSQDILNIPNKFDVNNLKYSNEYLWPYIRNDIGVAVNSLFDHVKRNVKLTGYLSQKGHNDNLPYEFRKVYKEEYNCHDIDTLKNNKIDFLFLTQFNSVEDILIDDKIYKRLIDPIYEKALNIGSALKIELIKVKSKKIQRIKNYYYDTIFILPPSIIRSGYFRAVDIDESLIDILNTNIKSLDITSQYINDLIDWNLHSRDYWINILNKITPKVLFFYGYHRQGPMISAAKFLGIKTVDIQHGIQVGWNPTYNNWNELPKDGYQSLPDYFALWGEYEFNNINDTFNSKIYKPILFGYPWLERQKDFYKDIPKDIKEIFLNYNVVILLTLQRQKKFPKFLKDLIIQSPKEILWVVRSHPKGKRFKKSGFLELENVYISDFTNECPVNQLYSIVDFNVSEGSATVLDAAYYNTVSIVTCPKGAENYKKEIKNNQVLTAYTKKDFFEITMKEKKASVSLDYFAKNINIETILKEMLD